MRDTAYIALGSNLGDRAAMLEFARTAIADLPETRVVGESRIDETEPIGPIEQPRFLNQMLAVETDLAPRALLAHLQAIETRAGRERAMRWGPRTLDLDIVCYERQTVDEADLHVPHAELPSRAFWLHELSQIRGRPWA
jgi:2-amino-4-hydroxy-6-hydroxymethyldihydropteridine diphosphokinase